MNARIKEVRLALNDGKKLSQQEFGQKLGVSRDVIANIESGRVEPTALFISHLCEKFGVNEIWLREGVGEMFRKPSRGEEISAFMGNILKAGDEDFRNELIGVLTQLSVEEWSLLEKMATKLAQDSKKETEQ